MERGDATCFLRTGYEVSGGTNGNRRGKVLGFTPLSADVLWDNGETETVDQFGHTLNVLDGGPPVAPWVDQDWHSSSCPDCYEGSDYDGA